MTLVKHRPQGSLVTPFDELFNGFFGRDLSHFIGSDDMQRSAPRVNITESKEGFKLDLLAPGFHKEDLKMNVENDTLTISAEKKNEALVEGERYTRREFGFSAFKRSFRLPENVTAENIKAEFTNGVLSVSIPKTEPAKPAVREISIA
jgi:HSP20 family protein